MLIWLSCLNGSRRHRNGAGAGLSVAQTEDARTRIARSWKDALRRTMSSAGARLVFARTSNRVASHGCSPRPSTASSEFHFETAIDEEECKRKKRVQRRAAEQERLLAVKRNQSELLALFQEGLLTGSIVAAPTDRDPHLRRTSSQLESTPAKVLRKRSGSVQHLKTVSGEDGDLLGKKMMSGSFSRPRLTVHRDNVRPVEPSHVRKAAPTPMDRRTALHRIVCPCLAHPAHKCGWRGHNPVD